MTGADPRPILAVDVGKTSCRVRVGDAELTGPGSVGLADPEGAEAVLRAVLDLLDADHRRHLAGAPACVAAAGHHPGRWVQAIATRFVDALGLASCAVTSDAVAAHVGAFAGGPGVVLAAGTGSMAIGVSAAGDLHLVDGVGQWLGDDGSGAWIGLEGLRAALRAYDGRGPATLLVPAAEREYGALAELPLTLQASGNVPRSAARFAPTVCGLVDRDDQAATIIDRAARALATTATTAARRSGHHEVTLVGGLQELGPALVDPWRSRLAEEGISVVPARGSALDGAALLAVDRELPHEPEVVRA
jgi:N-acetylglucosamine kinase-like BadF-type ATPase